jgi:L-alanine-DL-glutamate epimerase-like enolase superfamily enzyme
MMMIHLEKIRTLIEATKNETPEEFWAMIHPYLQHDMFALCALDMAYNDLYARKKGKKLYELWDYSIDKNPLTDYTIGIASIEKMVAKMKELPWPIYGWTVEETINNAIELKKLGVEFLEQPLKADNWEGHKEVFKHSVLPIIADESCIIEEDVAKCQYHFHGVNVKLVKCGGLTPGRRMIQEAKKLGLKTMVGCMAESTVGISAIAHLLPQLDFVDMDGALLLAEDIATGITLDFGKITYSDRNGTGVTLI